MEADTPDIKKTDSQKTNDKNTNNFIRDGFLSRFFTKKEETPQTLHETLEDLIDEEGGFDSEEEHERQLIANVLTASHLSAIDVMIPRADIVAINISASTDELLALLAEKPLSRIPVYRETLDDIAGCINIKDVLVSLARGERPIIENLIRDVMVVSPTLEALDLLLEMRETKMHIALIIDEFGGVDGLVTIDDVVEAIIGEINDEHDTDDEPKLIERTDGTILADARVGVDKLEEIYGQLLISEELEDIDTLGGLVVTLAGRLPTRGELIKHPNGLEIEIIDADARRIKQLRIHPLTLKKKVQEDEQ